MDYIGALVKRFESGSKGSLSLSQCGNDMGLSCGSYQLTLAWGNCINFLKKYFPNESAKLYYNGPYVKTGTYPGSKYCSSPTKVKSVWMECYNKVGADKFFQCEHEFIQNNYYNALLKKLGDRFNPNKHSRMAQECLWSWAVHRGSNGAYKELLEAVGDKDIQDMSATELIDIFYDYRFSYFQYNRYKKGISASNSERETLRSYCNSNPLPYDGFNASDGKIATGIKFTPTESKVWYRVRKSWSDSKSQKGAYSIPDNAKKCADQNDGYKVFNENGEVIYDPRKKFTPYMVKVTVSNLFIRKGPGTNYDKNGSITDKGTYTIVDESTGEGSDKGWGKLKSGVGWISLDFVKKRG